MRNCLVLGFGRSGTSLMGGILHGSGYYMGENLYPGRDTNPLGFFENDEINGINERILEPFDHCKINKEFRSTEKGNSPYKPGYGHRWLTYLPAGTLVESSDPEIYNAIAQTISKKCFAYKDPRFSYTLGVWNKHLHEDVMFICIFRQPAAVVESVFKECNTAEYLANFHIQRDFIFQLWFNSYSNVLERYYPMLASRMIFVHYEQLLNGSVQKKLSEKLEVALDFSFVSETLNRVKPKGETPEDCNVLYRRLCVLSGHHGV